MRKFFLIPLLTLVCSVMAWATNVATLPELQDALAAGGNITLTDNINAGATQLNITKATTIDGQGQFAIISSATNALAVTTAVEVDLKNLTIWAKTLCGIKSTAAATLNLDNVIINAAVRGIDHNIGGSNQALLHLTINNSTIQLISGLAANKLDAQGNPIDVNYDEYVYYGNGDYSRGINICRAKNSVIEINNSVVQGFYYAVNLPTTDCTGLQLTSRKTIYKGRDAYNIHATGANLTMIDCEVHGVNRWNGATESFACFVFDQNANNCSLTIQGGTFVSVAFPGEGAGNKCARQFFVSARGENNTIDIQNAQYTCPLNLGNNKGGLVEYIDANSQITIEDGVYICPQILQGYETTEIGTGFVKLKGGSYELTTVAAVDSFKINGVMYYDYPMYDVYTTNSVVVEGGTFSIPINAIPVEHPSHPELVDVKHSIIATGYKQVENANGTYSIVPETTEEKVVADGVNDVNWNTPADWATTSQEATVVPDESTSVAIGNGTEEVSVVVANDGAADVYRVDLNDKVTLTVQDGGVLTVGEGGIVSHENAAVVVAEGGSLVLNGLIQGTENIVIEASEENSAVVLIAPDVNTYGDEHPVGTFRFTSKSYKNGDKVVHQRFGMPTYNTGIDVKYVTTSSAKTYITNWDYEADDWKHSGDVVEWTEIPSTGALPLVKVGPFACYDLISNNAKGDEITYEFTGALMGNADGEMKFNRGFNPYANSYTAPIDIESFLNRIYTTYAGTDIKPTIYLYKAQANDNYTWASIGLDEFEFPDAAEFTQIAPMQAFMLYLGSSTPQVASIDYKDNVYDPFITKLSNPAPRRSASKTNFMSISIIDAEGTEYDRVKFIEDNRFSSAFEDGYDAVKFMKEDVAIYAAADEAQATVASDYVEGMNIGVKVAKSGVYTLNVKFNGLDYALIDTENNTIIELENGKTYNFFAEAGQNDARFQVIKVNKMPTAIDEVEDSQVMSTKMMKDGALYIIKNGAVYNAQGQIVK